MGWRFRKSFRLIPGVRLNISRSGPSITLGGSPVSLGLGPRGTHLNLGIPGSGIGYRHRLSSGGRAVPAESEASGQLVPEQPVEIVSASTYTLNSDSLAPMRDHLKNAHRERSEISSELGVAKPDRDNKVLRAERWDRGFLFRRIFKASHQNIQLRAEEAEDRVTELEEQLQLATIAAQVDASAQQIEAYRRMRISAADKLDQ